MCQGTTKDGNKCKNVKEPYCHLHETPPPKLDFPLPTVGLTPKVQKKIASLMKKGPSKSDGKGHIYCYFLTSDTEDCFYKIGRTSRTVDERLKEWGKNVKLKRSWEVKHEKWMEKLIHTYLDSVRVYRYQIDNGEEYCNVWKTDGKCVSVADEELKQKHKLEGIKKNIEWFKTPWKILKPILLALIKLD
jgi:hypothetical protein